jgi:ribosomal protein S18 acetylase RimI-like enzyme
MRIVVRRPEPADVPGMARVHVESWRETYRGLISDAVLDDPDFVMRRERFWTAALGSTNAIATAALDGEIVGVAMAGPPLDDDATWARQVYVLYTLEAVHGRGAGTALLTSVLDAQETAALWVADPNPRAQAFYRKHGFDFDGTSKVEDGLRELRMTRLLPSSR